MRRCDGCRFFHEVSKRADVPTEPDEVWGECRRHPPSGPSSTWPKVKGQDWCGDWMAIPGNFAG